MYTGWQSYWAEHGEYLVWNAWLEKYPDYVNPDMMDHVPVPAVAEVEVETSQGMSSRIAMVCGLVGPVTWPGCK